MSPCGCDSVDDLQSAIKRTIVVAGHLSDDERLGVRTDQPVADADLCSGWMVKHLLSSPL
jgi:hypothetical protein